MQVETQVNGAQFCSYRVGGPLDEAYLPKTLKEAISTLEAIEASGKPLTVLGGGSNTLIASQGIRGATFLAKRLMFTEPVDDTTFLIGAGVPLAKVCKLAQDHHLTGAEFMIGVPGTLGGALVMNAGAMGQDTAPLVNHVVLFNRNTGNVETWTPEKLAFSYRKSAINPACHIVLAAQLTFTPGDPSDIDALIKKSLTFRQTHHPKEPNGGSVFKNPAPEKPAGKLLDECGAKTWAEGGARVSPMHANFIVNTGGATSTDILRLMTRMKETVRARYNVEMFPENRFLGDATKEEIALWEDLTGHGQSH